MQAVHVNQKVAGTGDTLRRCPECGRHDSLIGLGDRLDRPHRWRCWTMMRTHIYACRVCDAIVEVREARGRQDKR